MRLLIFDSGVGGLSVASEIMKQLPQAGLDFLADTAVFPYGALQPDVLVDRVVDLMEKVIPALKPSAVVIACNTASTLVLGPLRARFPDVPFIGTVPAVKPAAASSLTRRVSVLATPGTVKRDYTHDLIRDHGKDCVFNLVGSANLASLVERLRAGEDISDSAFLAEIAPCFRDDHIARTDTIVLACTHYPLVLDRLKEVAPWPVNWIDPAPAIARQVVKVTAGAIEGSVPDSRHQFLATGRLPAAGFLSQFGFPPAVELEQGLA